MISVRNPSGALTAVQPMIRNPANALVPVSFGSRDAGGAPVVTQPPTPAISASAAPSSVSGAVSRPSGGNAQTNDTTVSVVGGTAPYTYAWSSTDGVMTATAPAAATTRFSAFVEAGDTLVDTFTCVVTDAKGQTADASIYASVSNYGKQLNAQL